jgi:hypothetical protein
MPLTSSPKSEACGAICRARASLRQTGGDIGKAISFLMGESSTQRNNNSTASPILAKDATEQHESVTLGLQVIELLSQHFLVYFCPSHRYFLIL